MRYALIVDGKVDNIIHLEERNVQDFSNAIFCEEYPVSIGDSYKDGKFLDKSGKEILSYQAQYEKEKSKLVQGFDMLAMFKDELTTINEYILEHELKEALKEQNV